MARVRGGIMSIRAARRSERVSWSGGVEEVLIDESGIGQRGGRRKVGK